MSYNFRRFAKAWPVWAKWLVGLLVLAGVGVGIAAAMGAFDKKKSTPSADFTPMKHGSAVRVLSCSEMCSNFPRGGQQYSDCVSNCMIDRGPFDFAA